MNTLNNENIIYVPNTLDGENIVSSHLEENALLIDGTNQMLANLNAGNYRLTHVSNAISATDAVNKSQLDLKADTTYVDTNFLNKTNTTTQSVASRLTFNNATGGSSFPIINITNAITGSNNGMYLRFFKNFNRLPDTEIGSIVFADKDAISPATNRAVQLTASIDSASNPLLNITFDSGIFNPLTISNTQTILRNNDFYIINKTTAQHLFTYLNASDKFTMYKPLDMNTTNKIFNIAEPTNNQDVASKFYVDSHSANNNYLLRNGTLAMTGNLNLATHNLTTTGDINCNDITADGNLSCADFNSAGNQVIGGSSANVLDVKSSAFFEANVLIETNKHLAFNSGTLSTTNGMLMNYDGGVGFLDMRGTEFRIRTAEAGVPNTIRFKVNDTNTTVRNNFFCDANCTFGNQETDTADFNCKTTIHNILTFATGSRIDGARVQLIKSGNISYEMSDNNVENGVLCNNSSTISITMPAKSAYWNNRCYFVKVRTATVNLVMNTDTRIDDDTSTLVMSSDFRGYLLQFDSDYENNGDIWRLCQI